MPTGARIRERLDLKLDAEIMEFVVDISQRESIHKNVVIQAMLEAALDLKMSDVLERIHAMKGKRSN